MTNCIRRWSSTALRTLSRSSGGGTADGRESLPDSVVCRQFGEATVTDAKQTHLLQVGLDHPPAASQVFQCPVLQQVDHGPPALLIATSRSVRCHWIPEEILGLKFHGIEHFRAEQREGNGTVPAQRLHDGSPELCHLHEVVQVTGLKGCVLAVIGEAKHLGFIPGNDENGQQLGRSRCVTKAWPSFQPASPWAPFLA